MSVRLHGGGGVKQDYIPDIYSPKVKERLHDNCVLPQLTNREFQGSFRNKGDTVIIRKDPKMNRRKYVRGVPLVYQDPDAGSERHTISRADYFAFKIESIDAILSDIKGFAGRWTVEAGKQMAEGREVEFLEWVPTVTDLAYRNCGNQAGIRTGYYELGEALDPVSVFPTEAKMAASAATRKNTMVDLITHAEAALMEHKGSRGLRPWIVIPVFASRLIQTSELKAAFFSGDPETCLRKSCIAVGKLSNLDIYVSNLLPMAQDPLGNFIFTCPFGDETGITYADEISVTEMGTSDQFVGTWHRTVGVYDFFPRYRERFGTVCITKGE